MFNELTQLKHLVVKLPLKKLLDAGDWRKVTSKVPTTFLVSPDTRKPGLSAMLGGRVMSIPEALFHPVWASIKESLLAASVNPFEAVYLTNDPEELQWAFTTHVGVALWNSPPKDIYPDVFVRTLDDLMEIVNSYQSGNYAGMWGEATATLHTDGKQYGTYRRYWWKSRLHDDLPKNVRLYILGRYFPERDARHDKHQYTRRILLMKNQREDTLAKTLSSFLSQLIGKEVIDVVTVVPPRPGKRDLHGLSLTVQFAVQLMRETNKPIYEDLLVCTQDYPSQKEQLSRNRPENVRGKFKLARTVLGRHVVIVDDIAASRSTLAECARVLLSGGARKVSAICFGVNQRVVSAAPLLPCPNPRCNGHLVARINKTDFGPFWGCTKYPLCRRTLYWDDGFRQANSLNTCDEIYVFQDLDF